MPGVENVNVPRVCPSKLEASQAAPLRSESSTARTGPTPRDVATTVVVSGASPVFGSAPIQNGAVPLLVTDIVRDVEAPSIVVICATIVLSPATSGTPFIAKCPAPSVSATSPLTVTPVLEGPVYVPRTITKSLATDALKPGGALGESTVMAIGWTKTGTTGDDAERPLASTATALTVCGPSGRFGHMKAKGNCPLDPNRAPSP